MPDPIEPDVNTDPTAEPEPNVDPAADPAPGADPDADPDPAAPAADDPDKGAKTALIAERKARKDAERKLAEAEQKLADKDKPADELALEQARRDAETSALAKANVRIVRAELKAAAAGKVKRPDLLLKVTDLSAIDVDDNGDPDSDALQEAVTAFLTEYPELAVDGSKFTGPADQGARGKAAKPSQLTQAELKKLSPSQVLQAYNDGRVDTLIGRKP
jgi:hypothetical protein